MRIARIDVYPVDLPVSGGIYRLSGGRIYSSYDATIIRVTTDYGRTGWGESTPFGATYVAAHAGSVRAGLALLAPAPSRPPVGADATDAERPPRCALRG
nr:hypothetical protein [uncultured Roseovarius sp.]